MLNSNVVIISFQSVLLTNMALIVIMNVSVRTKPNATPKRGLAAARRVGQGHIATSCVRQGRLVKTVSRIVLVNPAMLRDLVT